MRLLPIVTTLLVTLTVGCSTSKSGSPPPATSVTDPPRTSTSAGVGDCEFQTDLASPPPPGKDVGLPTGTAERTTSRVGLETSAGAIVITPQPAGAPCTVRSFVHLARAKFFDGTTCHRLTTAAQLKVLQCGDPTAGGGFDGPGYTVPDENPTDLPAGPQPGTVIYPRGTVAMANTGLPNSGGSQFFLVYGDSVLSPTYAVFGRVDELGLAALDRIAAAGLTPVNSPEDGTPTTPVTIQRAAVDG